MNKLVEFVKRNSSTILSITAMVGVVGTGVASGIAAKKAEEDNKNTKNVKEYIKTYWYYYIPVIGIGVITCGCIGMSESINRKRQAALISACALTAEAFREYREIVTELYGEDGDKKIKDVIRNRDYEDLAEKPEGDELLFYDEFSRRYFNATMEAVKDAEYHFNRNYILRGYAELNELYEFLELEKIPEGDVLGWSTFAEGTYGYKWVDFYHEKVVMDDGLECYILKFPFEPHADYLEC